MFYYLVSKAPLESSVRTITPTDAWDTLYAWYSGGNNSLFSMSLPDIQGDYICWSHPYNTPTFSKSLYAFSRVLDEFEIGDL